MQKNKKVLIIAAVVLILIAAALFFSLSVRYRFWLDKKSSVVEIVSRLFSWLLLLWKLPNKDAFSFNFRIGE